MKEAVIFDMDGVIIDSEPFYYEIEKDINKELGIDVSIEEHKSFVGVTSYNMWNALKKKYGLKQTVDELMEMTRSRFVEFLESQRGKINPIDGVKELIISLHENGFKLAVASSSGTDIVNTVIDIFDLYQYFDAIVTGDEVLKSKPEPDIFLYAADKLNVPCRNAVVIEDSHNGVLAAKNAKITCIGYKNPNSFNQDISMADKIIKSFNEIDYNFIRNL